MATLTVGQRIKQLRKERGLSQMQLAQKIYYGQKAVSMWERDKNEPSFNAVKALCSFFKITFEELTKGVD